MLRRVFKLAGVLSLLSCTGRDSTGPRTEDTVVASISVSFPRTTIHPGDSVQASATPRNAANSAISGLTVSWSSDNTAVASISSTGMVKALTVGTANISASVAGKSGTTVLTVVVIPIGSMTFTPDTASVTVGQATVLSLLVKDSVGNTISGRQTTWTSSDSTKARVSSTGVVTALAAGNVDITASAEGKSAVAHVRILPVVSDARVASVVVTMARNAFRVGESLQAAALALDSLGGVLTGRNISWTSSNPDVATVSTSGLVTGTGPGTASISAQIEGRSGQILVQLSLVPVSSVTVSPETQTVSSGASITLVAVLKDSANRVLSGRSIAWSSNIPTVASVNSEGVVTGLLVGTASITATSENVQGRANISVNTLNSPVATITLDPSTANMSGGATKQITATLRDANGNVLGGRAITWTSSNPERATVNGGVVTASPIDGSTTITASAEGKSAAATIGVLTFVRMSSGSGFSCGLTADGTAYCWGANGNGQLGDGTTTNRALPVAVSGGVKFATIASGVSHSCGIGLNGFTYCWGQNFAGQVGDGTTALRLTPTPVSGNFNFVSVAPASRNTCATTASREVYCWGLIPSTDVYGSFYPQIKPTPVNIGSNMVAVVAGLDERYCSVDPAGLAYCWNLEYFYPPSGPAVPPIRGPVSTTLSFATVRVGYGHACGIVANGQAYCWGSNNVGQLGNGTTTDNPDPVLVSGGKLFSALALGGTSRCVDDNTCSETFLAGISCGLTLNGEVYCWGANVLGSGKSSVPDIVPGSSTFTGIRAGSSHICGLATSGAAYCWGNNGSGQLGTGTTTPSSQPTFVFGK